MRLCSRSRCSRSRCGAREAMTVGCKPTNVATSCRAARLLSTFPSDNNKAWGPQASCDQNMFFDKTPRGPCCARQARQRLASKRVFEKMEQDANEMHSEIVKLVCTLTLLIDLLSRCSNHEHESPGPSRAQRV